MLYGVCLEEGDALAASPNPTPSPCLVIAGMSMKPLKSLFIAALLLLVGSGITAADDGESVRSGAAVTFLQINDVYSAVPVDSGKAGGLARVAALKKRLAAAGKTVVLTLAGDFLSPSVASTVFKGRQMVDSLNAAGLDIATLGNHEFDFGPEVMVERMREAKWQWVVSNVTDERTRQPVGGAFRKRQALMPSPVKVSPAWPEP